MLFWILLNLPVACFLVAIGVWAAGYRKNYSNRYESAAAGFAVATLFSGIVSVMACGVSWNDQANDLGRIEAQATVIAVYQQQVTDLTGELASFKYQPGTLLNADSPVASVVAALSAAQQKLTEAKVAKAQAMVSIEQRRRGPMSGVIQLVGDYK